MSRLPLVCVCCAALTVASGCAYSFGHKFGHKTREDISVSESAPGRGCTAVIAVTEAVDGKIGHARRAGVPCADIAAVKGELIATAKRGL